LLAVIWTYFRLPEPKGRTIVEMDMLFEHVIAARKFATTDASVPAARSAFIVPEKSYNQKSEATSLTEGV
jgi:MFS transporter, SP family, general alpha glucoside:H+ symporter